MSSAPYQHPGSPPPRPELPEGVAPSVAPPGFAAPTPWQPPVPAPAGGRPDLPPFAVWAPLVAMLATVIVAGMGFLLITIAVEASGTNVDADDLPTGITVGGTVIQQLAMIASALLFGSLASRPTAEMFGLRRTRFWRAVGWAALVFFAFYLFSFIWTVALGIDESDNLAEELGAKDSTLNLILIGLMVTVGAPIAEELFFRGFTFPALWRKFGMWPAAIITGLAFGGIHIGGTPIEFLVPLAVFGFLLCLLYRWTGSLLPCIVLHSINNAVALGVTLEWRWWQVIAGLVAAPLLVSAIVVPLSARRPAAPAPAV